MQDIESKVILGPEIRAQTGDFHATWRSLDSLLPNSELNTELLKLPEKNLHSIVIDFKERAPLPYTTPDNFILASQLNSLFTECLRILEIGGLLWMYGDPVALAPLGASLTEFEKGSFSFDFKYWIAVDASSTSRGETLRPAHKALLLFKKREHSQRSTHFHLNTKTVRAPFTFCASCGQNVKDWGGKKHLMNPHGSALSDVWRAPENQIENSDALPSFALTRIKQLVDRKDARCMQLLHRGELLVREEHHSSLPTIAVSRSSLEEQTEISLDQVYQEDCASFLKKVSARHSNGLFDLVFADPPYNLRKHYDTYDDRLEEHGYLEWCDEWLTALSDSLKPGGALFLLNLPKWAMHHATLLHRSLEFRHWIVWDALSDPRGKLMPAHYSLLYYTKPGRPPVFNYAGFSSATEQGSEKVEAPDSLEYCLRPACVRKRKAHGDDRRTELSDIWSDVHRIKHKRDRDAHPCQLPEKLLERIIRLTTNRGGIVFDPFCGAGTTAIAAKRLGRRYVTIDIDPHYVEIARNKLEALDADREAILHRPTKRERKPFLKREIELSLQSLAKQLGRVPSEEDIRSADEELLGQIDVTYPSRRAAIKRCRIALER